MFLLDSLMIAGIRWTLETVVSAADAEMNDDTALREQLLEAEMRRELGAIDEAAFRAIEADLVARMRGIRARREGGAGPLAITAGTPIGSTSGATFAIEASVTGDFHEPEPLPDPVPRPAPNALIEAKGSPAPASAQASASAPVPPVAGARAPRSRVPRPPRPRPRPRRRAARPPRT